MTEDAILALVARLLASANNDIILNTMSHDSNTYLSRLEYLALYDPLTELSNRALLFLSETDEMQASRIAHKIEEILEPPFVIEGIPSLTADQLIAWMETAEWPQ